ncbi:hypothetical protein D9758_008457 [Tetrapyrgos nigripes]|uniref:Uncharacterized protein n=1 Tax=Tetrapyrgos nigripes TaxID=182062 RepID=A0A8H5CP28_9AGAR|nr:hypothetical protein D9758_008457 [Tetrapyrgos nigripes]
MELWPTNGKSIVDEIDKKGKDRKKERASGYPLLEPGRLEAVSLVETNGRFKWTSTFEISTADKILRQIQAGRSTKVFPSTRSAPPQLPHISISQHAEQSANFLRTYLPDVNIATELIRNELATDDAISRELERYDPMQGNVLEVCQGLFDSSVFLAFPMGETACDLNLSPLILNEDSLIFRPKASATRSFPTPILQILSPPSSEQKTLAVRTLGSTYLLRAENVTSSGDSVGLTELAHIARHDLERPVSDISFHLQTSEVITCNDQGDVYICRLQEGEKLLKRVYQNPTHTLDKFWRLGSPRSDGCLLMSEKAVTELDFRATNTAIELFSVLSLEECLTSIEDNHDEHSVQLLSTDQILWMDRRFPGKPLLGLKHKRQWDRSLAMRTLATPDGTTRTLLTSGKNDIVTVYDVGRSSDGLLHAYNLPYTLTPGGERMRFLGQTVLQLPGYTPSLFRFCQRGAIYRTDLKTEEEDSGTFKSDWSSEVQALDERSNALKPDLGPLSAMEYSEVNMNPHYNSIIVSHMKEDAAREEAMAEDTYELIDTLPSFWQRADASTDEMMTTYDMVFRSGEEPNSGSRSDFLTGSAFNTTRGYRAMVKDRFPMDTLRSQAAWHHDIGPTLKNFDPTTSGDIHEISECLRRFDVSTDYGEDDEHPSEASIRRQETKAREQLALDLALSKDIFSSRKFNSTSSASEKELETMTKALSIGNEGPVAEFRYLEPKKKNHNQCDKDGRSEEEHALIPLGVRLLLRDWEVGVDPDKDGYHSRRPTEDPAEKKKSMPRTWAQYEPVIRSAEKPPPVPASQGNVYESQSTQVDSQSQNLMTSTQVLPGPFGARPNAIAAKKKAWKKRMGGF